MPEDLTTSEIGQSHGLQAGRLRIVLWPLSGQVLTPLHLPHRLAAVTLVSCPLLCIFTRAPDSLRTHTCIRNRRGHWEAATMLEASADPFVCSSAPSLHSASIDWIGDSKKIRADTQHMQPLGPKEAPGPRCIK